jgi:hypothetical protein
MERLVAMRTPRWIALIFFAVLVVPGAAHADSPQLDVVGHLSLPVGGGDVSVHGKLVAVAIGPSSGHPRSVVQLIDIADPAQPRAGATLTAPRYVWYQDPRLLAVETPTFKGDLLVVGGYDIPGTGAGSVEFWDVRNPSEPHLLGRLPAPGSGVRSLDLIRREGHLFALLAVNGDDVWVVDATDLARPLLVSIWQADPDVVRNVRRGVYLDTVIAHVRANTEGTRAYVPTGDAGTFIVDLADLNQPRTLGRAAYGMEDEGNAFDAAEVAGGGVLVTTDRDSSVEPAGISLNVLNPGMLRRLEHAIEPDFTQQLVATRPVRGEVVYVGSALAGQPLLADPRGKIALVDPAESPDIANVETKSRQMQADQAQRLREAGAIGVLFGGLLDRTSTQRFRGVPPRAEIPGTSIDRGLADAMRVQLAAGKTVEVEMAAGPATFGFVRFWDLRNIHRKGLTQISSFATPETRQTPPAGSYATFSAERLTLHDNRLYVTWSSDGVRVLDITDPAQPREIGHFIPPAEAVNGGPLISSIGHVVEQNGLLFASGPNSLWILRDVPR